MTTMRFSLFELKFSLVVCFCLLINSISGQGIQKETSVWYLNTGVGIKFPGPTLVKDCKAIPMYEAMATMADKDGNVLFYTNGMHVYDASNTFMENGRDLDDGGSSAQGILATNDPGNKKRFYLFSTTASAEGKTKPFRYSIVDMTLPGNGTTGQPLGQVTEKAISLTNGTVSEKVAATSHNNCKDIWVATQSANSNTLHVFLVNEDGVTKTGDFKLGNGIKNFEGNRGSLCFSPDGTKLAVTSHDVITKVFCEVYNFDNVTGEITGPIASMDAKQTNRADGYGAAFSPNGKILYISHHATNYIEQYDLTAADVQASRFDINPGGSGGMATGIELGPDGIIYIARFQSQYLSTITNPNGLKGAANYVEQAVNVEGSLAHGLPQMYIADETIMIDSIVKIDIGCDGILGEIQIYINGAGPFKYSIDGGKNLQDSHIFKNLKKGLYDIYVENANGCFARDTISILEKEKIEVNIEGPVGPFCIFEPKEIELKATPEGGIWSGKGVDPETGIFDPEEAGEGTHVITYSVEDECDGKESIEIDVFGKVTTSIDPVDNMCSGADPIQLIGKPKGGIFIGPSVTKDGLFDPAGLADGIYTIQYILELGACSDSTTIDITIVPTPVITITGDPLEGCSPLAVNFTYTTDIPIVSCNWNFGNGEQSNKCENARATYIEPKCYNVSISTESKDGCKTTTLENDLVCVHPDPIANFNFNPKPAKMDNPRVNFINQSTGASIYSWTFADLGSSAETHPSFLFPGVEGFYNTCLTAESEFGCIDTICKPVEVIEEFSIYVPNAFSPNSDGLNDFFFPLLKGHDKDQFKMWIYNRWGELIYFTEDIDKTWAGKTRNGNKLQKQEVYVWKVQAVDRFKQEKHVFVGHVSLLK